MEIGEDELVIGVGIEGKGEYKADVIERWNEV